jgi:hypothetical protein
MVSPTLTDEMRSQVREIMGRRVVEPFAAVLSAGGAADAELRAEILVATAVGVALTRASGTLPTLARAPLDEVLAVLGTLIDALHEDGR